VIQVEKGAGECPARDAEFRLEYMPCNEQACKPTVVCQSKLDLVLLLDGSGSLKSTGWKQTVEFGQMFINSLTGGENHVQLSVILFSGPTRWSVASKCTGSSNPAPTLKECGIQIVQHFTTDMKKAADVVKGLEWPAATTLTSQALMTAKAELSLGRKDAQSVVVVVTDGRPMNRDRTAQASKDVREVARLIWVPVTQFAPLTDIRKWASTPASENIIQLEDFWTMTDPDTISNIIADMCPKLNQTDLRTTTSAPR